MKREQPGEGPVIQCRPNGPLLVRNLERLRNSRGDALPTQAAMALCRCGGSANKPFCDGTHRKIGFSSERTAGETGPRATYVGKGVTIHDDRSICAGADFCTAGLAAVFRSDAEPWIDPDGADVEAVIETIRKCPSGALSYTVDGVEHRDWGGEPAITVSKDGPYHVTGGCRLEGTTRAPGASEEHYTLCRCGASANKPFCDGSHWNSGFHDEKD